MGRKPENADARDGLAASHLAHAAILSRDHGTIQTPRHILMIRHVRATLPGFTTICGSMDDGSMLSRIVCPSRSQSA